MLPVKDKNAWTATVTPHAVYLKRRVTTTRKSAITSVEHSYIHVTVTKDDVSISFTYSPTGEEVIALPWKEYNEMNNLINEALNTLRK